MTTITINPAASVRGEITVPGDKSISHRSIMLGAIANGTTTVRGFLRGGDNMATMGAFRSMGVQIDDDGETVVIHGRGLHGLSEPGDVHRLRQFRHHHPPDHRPAGRTERSSRS